MPTSLPITLISAGAGSGKTYRLTQELTRLLASGAVRPAGIIATTFTRKAAAELQERVRVKLLEEGMTEAANELGAAFIGTVHSVGTRLLQRFAFEAGVSPLVEIIADGDEQRIFNESLAQVLTEEKIEQFNALADRLGLTKKTGGGKQEFDWRKHIHAVTDVARANNFDRAVLEKSKAKSWQAFQKFLPEPSPNDAQTWNNQLLFHLENTAESLDNQDLDQTKKTKDVAIALRTFANQLRWQEKLDWHEWVKIGKQDVGAKSKDTAAPLLEFAQSHPAHAQFQADVRDYIFGIFDAAISALEEFAQYKKRRGLIDYTDMETVLSRLVRLPAVRETLRAELDLLLVDEFQDTSPIQLDIFLQISQLAKTSIWVGDPKQSIYGFRGADPALMQAIIEQTGGVRPENILDKSWRSRADIVRAVNAIFCKAFPQFPPAQVALEPERTPEKDAPNQPPALVHWHFKSELDERKVPGSPWAENCLADQTRILLERRWPVVPKGEKTARPLRPGDVAVLCRSNDECLRVAEALHRAGLKASIARAGLLDTREAQLVLACLKFLLSPSDALAVAEIRLLAGGESLAEIVDDRLDFLRKKRAAVENENVGRVSNPSDVHTPERWGNQDFHIQKLLELRPRTADLSASEILGLLLDELDLRRTTLRFDNAPQRLDNLDMLRRFALEYEDACTRLHSAATLGGFLLWLKNLENADKDAQGSGENPDAVNVLTYHKSKGLEYPATIVSSLTQKLRESIWGVNLVAETEAVDLDNILGNRWLRFWVNPYADQLRNTRIDDQLRESPEFAVATAQALAEEARLLYVGLTRARDYLIFPTNRHPTEWLNRTFNNGQGEIPTLDENSQETPFYWKNEVVRIATEVSFKPKDFPDAALSAGAEPPVRFHANRRGKAKFLENEAIDALLESPPNFQPPSVGEPIEFAGALDLTTFEKLSNLDGDPAERLAKLHRALTNILLADNLKLPAAERLRICQKQLEINELVSQNLSPVRLAKLGGETPWQVRPEDLSRHSEAFFQFLKTEFSPKKLARAWPLRAKFEGRLLDVSLDFLLENESGFVLLQTCPPGDGRKSGKQQAAQLAPFFGWAAWALGQIFPGKRVRAFALLPLEGCAVELVP